MPPTHHSVVRKTFWLSEPRTRFSGRQEPGVLRGRAPRVEAVRRCLDSWPRPRGEVWP